MSKKQPKPFSIRERIALFLFLNGPSTLEEVWRGCDLRTFETEETRWREGKPPVRRLVTKRDTGFFTRYDERCARSDLPQHEARIEEVKREIEGPFVPDGRKLPHWSDEAYEKWVRDGQAASLRSLEAKWYGSTGEKRRSPTTGRPTTVVDLTRAGREHVKGRLAELAGWHATRRPSKPRPIA